MKINKSVLKKIAAFSLPYLLSVFMQTLYGMADLFIIGQFNGVESTACCLYKRAFEYKYPIGSDSFLRFVRLGRRKPNFKRFNFKKRF